MHFNHLPRESAESALLACLASSRWARRIAGHRPYPDIDSLLAATDEAAYDLSLADVDEALAGEARPEAPPHGTGHLAALTALDAAHSVYEARFGHVFLLCLDGYGRDEMLDQVLHAIRSRLGNDPEDERVVAVEELRRLSRGRITRMVRAQGDAAKAPQCPDSGHPDSPYVPV